VDERARLTVPHDVPPEHRAFADQVAASRLQDPMSMFETLSRITHVPVDELVHHALVRWAAAGSEALLSIEPQVIADLAAARDREDWDAVAGIIDWLRAGSQ
jgi:hypothetical protein